MITFKNYSNTRLLVTEDNVTRQLVVGRRAKNWTVSEINRLCEREVRRYLLRMLGEVIRQIGAVGCAHPNWIFEFEFRLNNKTQYYYSPEAVLNDVAFIRKTSWYLPHEIDLNLQVIEETAEHYRRNPGNYVRETLDDPQQLEIAF